MPILIHIIIDFISLRDYSDVSSALIDAIGSSSYLIDAMLSYWLMAHIYYIFSVTMMLGRFLSAVNIIYEHN